MFTFPETILSCLCLNIVSLVLFSVFNQESDDDRDVVRQAVKGNREAFDILVEKYVQENI